MESPSAPIEAEVEGNHLRLLPCGSDRGAAIIDLIDRAEESVRILIYMFDPDEEGTKIRDALAAAAARGVRVTTIIDDFGSKDAKDEFFEPINSAGGDHCMFHPRAGRRYFIRNHQKLAIADGRIALIGGANFNKDYLSDDLDTCWRDLWLRIEGPAVDHAARYYDALDQFTKTGDSSTKRLRRIICDFSQSDGKLRWLFGGPRPPVSPMLAAITGDIGRADRLDLIAAYFSPSRALLKRIGAVASRGEANVLTAGKSDNDATIAAARHTYRRLLKRKVGIYEWTKCKLHTKLLLLDDISYVGSSNFDFRSLYINLEMMLRIEDENFTNQLREFARAEMADSVHFTPAYYKRQAGWWNRLKWAISRWLTTTMDYTVSRRLNFPISS